MRSITIEIPDDLFEGLLQAAAAEKSSPAEWIIARLPRPWRRPPGAKTMYDLFAPHIGKFSSGSGQPSSENAGESFAEYLEEKHRNGRL